MNTTEHLLTIVSEECNEVSQRVSKALRFGLREVEPGQELNNLARIVYEFNDLIGAMEMLMATSIQQLINPETIEAKKNKISKFLEYSRLCGTVSSEETITVKKEELIDLLKRHENLLTNRVIPLTLDEGDLKFTRAMISDLEKK